jgi:hypothetical protein
MAVVGGQHPFGGGIVGHIDGGPRLRPGLVVRGAEREW